MLRTRPGDAWPGGRELGVPTGLRDHRRNLLISKWHTPLHAVLFGLVVLRGDRCLADGTPQDWCGSMTGAGVPRSTVCAQSDCLCRRGEWYRSLPILRLRGAGSRDEMLDASDEEVADTEDVSELDEEGAIGAAPSHEETTADEDEEGEDEGEGHLPEVPHIREMIRQMSAGEGASDIEDLDDDESERVDEDGRPLNAVRKTRV